MKIKLVNLAPIKEIDVNDPALMRARAAKDKINQMKSNKLICAYGSKNPTSRESNFYGGDV